MAIENGTRLGPYEIVAPIGAGGMGEVYRARDTRLGRDVAIKILPADFAQDAKLKIRFEREAKTISHLTHPNICTLFDVGENYLVMELLEGESLEDRLARGPLSLTEVVRYGVQLAEALGKAHREGIVHRDVKPGNVMLTKSGAKLLDFGLAKSTALADLPGDATVQKPLTQEGTVLGTFQYMAPEQLAGEEPDARTDIFALGAVVYEMATGKRAFEGKDRTSLVRAIVSGEPRPIRELQPLTPPALEHVILKCLEKEADDRWQNAADVAAELRWISEGGSKAGVPAPIVVHHRLRETVAWLLATAALVVAAGGGWMYVRTRSTSRPIIDSAALLGASGRSGAEAGAISSKRFAQLTYSGQDFFPSLAPDGKTIAFSSRRSGTDDIYVQRVDGGSAIDLTKDSPAADFQPAFSPDGNWIAFRSDRDGGGIFVMGATGESVRRVTDFGFNPSWSPDGRQIAVSTESTAIDPRSRSSRSSLWVVDVRSGQKRPILNPDAVQPSWSPHGKRVAYWGLIGESGQRDIWTIDPGAARPETTIVPVTSDAALDWSPAWSPDGRWIYFGSDRNGTVNLWRVAIDEASGKTRGEPEPVTLPATFAGHFSFARDSGELAFVSINQTAVIWRVPFDPVALRVAGAASRVIRGSLVPFSLSAISPDGQWLAFPNEGSRQDLYLLRSDGSEMRQLTNDPEIDRGPSFSPDGKTIYFYSQRTGRYAIWSIHTDGSGLRKLSTDDGPSLWYPRPMPGRNALYGYNPYGPAIVPFNADGTLGKPEALPPFPVEGSHLALPVVSPDGSMMAGVLRDPPDQRGVWIWSFVTRKYERAAPDAFAPQWLPGSSHIVLAIQDNHLVALDVVKKSVREISQPVASFTEITIAPDGRTLYLLESTTDSVVWMMR